MAQHTAPELCMLIVVGEQGQRCIRVRPHRGLCTGNIDTAVELGEDVEAGVLLALGLERTDWPAP